MDPASDNPITPLRASDRDRDNAAAILGNALAEGRLTPPEHAERLDAVYAARTCAARKDVWHPGPVIDVLSVLGGAVLDFRDAVLPGKEIHIRSVIVLGGLKVMVPPDMVVVSSVTAVLGDVDIKGAGGPPGPGNPLSAPVLRISGTAILGNLEVRRKAPRLPREQRRGLAP